MEHYRGLQWSLNTLCLSSWLKLKLSFYIERIGHLINVTPEAESLFWYHNIPINVLRILWFKPEEPRKWYLLEQVARSDHYLIVANPFSPMDLAKFQSSNTSSPWCTKGGTGARWELQVFVLSTQAFIMISKHTQSFTSALHRTNSCENFSKYQRRSFLSLEV